MIETTKIMDTIKKLSEFAERVKDIDARTAVLDLKEEILSLREENLKLREQLIEKEKFNMKFEESVYWNIKENGEKEGPFCSACWDKDKKAIHLSPGAYSSLICPVCKTIIPTGEKNDFLSSGESSIDWC
ncbi:MAG: hypothetical protein IKR09_09635 [Alphaproteobacteria bacterium]|nr:hypothetical protein [Alphaproteobacteria bacterium]